MLGLDYESMMEQALERNFLSSCSVSSCVAYFLLLRFLETHVQFVIKTIDCS